MPNKNLVRAVVLAALCVWPGVEMYRLYAANQDSDTIVAFRVDRQSGTLTPTGQVEAVGSPSTIVFR